MGKVIIHVDVWPDERVYSELNLNQYSVASPRLAVLSVLSAARRLVLI